MTSPRRSQGKPVESVSLRITFAADGREAARIRKALPGVVVRGGACEVEIESTDPGTAAKKAKDILGKLRGVS